MPSLTVLQRELATCVCVHQPIMVTINICNCGRAECFPASRSEAASWPLCNCTWDWVLATTLSASLLPSVSPGRKSKHMRRRRSVMAVTCTPVWLPWDQDHAMHRGTCSYQLLIFYYASQDSCKISFCMKFHLLEARGHKKVLFLHKMQFPEIQKSPVNIT